MATGTPVLISKFDGFWEKIFLLMMKISFLLNILNMMIGQKLMNIK